MHSVKSTITMDMQSCIRIILFKILLCVTYFRKLPNIVLCKQSAFHFHLFSLRKVGRWMRDERV